MSHDTGGQAFPSTHTVTTATGIKLEDHHPGMALRDYFAGQALVARGNGIGVPLDIARDCYALADAMLKARGE